MRQLNPHARLVVRSAKENLNQLLEQYLSNFIAFEPTQLSASAFALAALGTETLGLFELDGEPLRVVQHRVQPHEAWYHGRPLYDFNSHRKHLLGYSYQSTPIDPCFHQWEPQTKLQPGDTIVYLEIAVDFFFPRQQLPPTHQRPQQLLSFFQKLKHNLSNFWQLSWQQQLRRVALICGVVVLLLLLLGTILFHFYYPDSTWLSAFHATAILLLGGYGDLFGDLELIISLPWWLQLFSLVLTASGTAFVGVLYALLTQALISTKFEFVKRRPPIPQANQIVIIGLGKVGIKIATILQSWRQLLLGITFNSNFEPNLLPQMSVIIAPWQEALSQANLARAKSVVIVTDDEMLNLEVALLARAINPHSHLVVSTFGRRLSKHLSQLIPSAQVLCSHALAAEAFAGAAFGENIIQIFRWQNRTILVTEYQIEAGDTLNGLMLAEVVYGYGVVAVLHQKPPASPILMPS